MRAHKAFLLNLARHLASVHGHVHSGEAVLGDLAGQCDAAIRDALKDARDPRKNSPLRAVS